MSSKPILFSAPMVRALLEGRKTQTRRVAKFIEPIPERGTYHIRNSGGGLVGVAESDVASSAPDYAPHQPGDRLWVRESWGHDGPSLDDVRRGVESGGTCYGPYYMADADWFNNATIKKRPSIHMPRWASRITLVVTGVRVQRLREISAADTIAEGVECETCRAMGTSACEGRGCFASKQAFAALWQSINGRGSWDANPWVAAYTFTVHKRNIDNMEPANE